MGSSSLAELAGADTQGMETEGSSSESSQLYVD